MICSKTQRCRSYGALVTVAINLIVFAFSTESVRGSHSSVQNSSTSVWQYHSNIFLQINLIGLLHLIPLLQCRTLTGEQWLDLMQNFNSRVRFPTRTLKLISTSTILTVRVRVAVRSPPDFCLMLSNWVQQKLVNLYWFLTILYIKFFK